LEKICDFFAKSLKKIQKREKFDIFCLAKKIKNRPKQPKQKVKTQNVLRTQNQNFLSISTSQ
jgi:hypothetical protein